ncbi:hypothetical protein HZS55_05010 [Halosimplex rubrum]|uniref:Preprotein translocase subunit TatA n=1 Tax=Halosimplex rubrum TaxID=869889 RepID=A0A7D5P3N7_9EURY|nr:hypothetical protein [Halosimplex rubrum]QLH76702.1 hypothetical protein HZS55_05010 [Halosimplex rubrum]
MVPPLVLGLTELVVILVNLGIVAGVIGGVVYLVRRVTDSGDDERIEDLEAEVEELREERDSGERASDDD